MLTSKLYSSPISPQGVALINADEFRSAMSRFATGVTVVTTLDHDGEVHGMTANAFTSVCLEPPVVLICIAHQSHTRGFIEARGRLGVNILSAEQQPIARYFAKPPEDRHGEVEYEYSISPSGVPTLDGSLVSFQCRVVGAHEYGDHTVFIAEVEEMKLGDSADPLLFYEGHWAFSLEG